MKKLNRRKFMKVTSKGIIMSMLTPSFFIQPHNGMSSPSGNVLAEDNANNWVNYFDQFTTTYRNHSNNIYRRELECLKLQLPKQACKIMPHDLIAGRIEMLPIGFAPQSDSGSLGYYIHSAKIRQLLEDPELAAENKKRLQKLIAYWEKEDTKVKIRNAYPEKMKKVLSSDNWNGESGIAFPLYRMSGVYLDIRKLIKLGLPGLREEVRGKGAHAGSQSKELFAAMEGMLDAVSELCTSYAAMAATLAKQENNLERRVELMDMQERLTHIATNKPATFAEALQLAFLYTQISGTFNYGRYDDVFGDLYVRDLEQKVINEKQAIRLIKSMFTIIDDRGNVFDSRVFIGGKGRTNEAASDKLALAIMQAHHELKNVTPQLSLRFYMGQNPALWEKALDMIGDGCTFPILYNDDVNIPAVERAFGLSGKEAQHYLPFGCGEYVINHKSVGTPSGVINLLQALLVTLNNGVNPSTGKAMGLPGLEDYTYSSFDDLWKAYCTQVEYHVDQLALQEELEYKVAGETAPFLLYSILFDDCLLRGKPIFAGGARYLGGTLETYGNTNTADSLTALKNLVYDQKKFSLDQMKKMLSENFAGYDTERKWMLEAPKYGNDLDDADAMLVNVDHHVFHAARNQKNKTGLHSYLVVNINNNANTVMGRYTAASPDGRKKFTYMANANAPSGGMDQNGITAMLNSVVKPDPGIHAGMVQNLKFSKSLFRENRSMADALLKTYFEKGGTQAMINVLGREDLEMALLEPEKYTNLIVRVGGYSAKFVELPKDIQQEILSRTLY